MTGTYDKSEEWKIGDLWANYMELDGYIVSSTTIENTGHNQCFIAGNRLEVAGGNRAVFGALPPTVVIVDELSVRRRKRLQKLAKRTDARIHAQIISKLNPIQRRLKIYSSRRPCCNGVARDLLPGC